MKELMLKAVIVDLTNFWVYKNFNVYEIGLQMNSARKEAFSVYLSGATL
jgi:hypothetical protein